MIILTELIVAQSRYSPSICLDGLVTYAEPMGLAGGGSPWSVNRIGRTTASFLPVRK
jgi:hypothetical protein